MDMTNIKAEIERDYEVELDPSGTADAWTSAYTDTFTETGVQGAYHLYENGFEDGDADEADFQADAERLKLSSTGLVLGYLDDVFSRHYRENLVAICEGTTNHVCWLRKQEASERDG